MPVLVAGSLTNVGVTAAALSIVASGGALASTFAASAISGTGALIARHLGRERAKELETQMTAGGLVLPRAQDKLIRRPLWRRRKSPTCRAPDTG